MTDTIDDLEKKVLQLSEAARGRLAGTLIRSLPGVLHDDDEGLAEAIRRDEELNDNPDLEISMDKLEDAVRRRRK